MNTAEPDTQNPDTGTTTGSAWLDLHLRPFSRQAGLSKPFAHTGFVMQANVLRDRVTEAGAVTLLRGEPGIGRHALLDHVAEELGSGVYWHRLQIRSDEDLAQALARRFPDSSSPEVDWVQLIEGDDVDPNQSVVVVEDAHRLAPRDLGDLIRLVAEERPRASLVLVAEPSIEQRLVGLGADMATRIHTLSVLPLRRNQLSDYIAHRLRAAGIHSRSPLGDPELRRIYRETGGVPGRINEAARTILEEIYETDHEDSGYGQMSGNPATTALLISGALLVITGGAWLWTQMDARDSPRPELAANARTQTEASPSGPAAANRRDAPPLPAEAAPAPTPDRGGTAGEQAGPQTGDDAAGRAPSAPAGPSTPIKATASASTVATDPGQQAEQTPSPPEPPSGLRGPDWLMAQPEQSYTLQVVAVREFAAVERLCEDPQACAGAAWFSEQRDETTWYRVVVGAYPTRAEALAAAEELPRSLRDQKPWVRSLRDVQRAIAAGSHSPKTGN